MALIDTVKKIELLLDADHDFLHRNDRITVIDHTREWLRKYV